MGIGLAIGVRHLHHKSAWKHQVVIGCRACLPARSGERSHGHHRCCHCFGGAEPCSRHRTENRTSRAGQSHGHSRQWPHQQHRPCSSWIATRRSQHRREKRIRRLRPRLRPQLRQCSCSLRTLPRYLLQGRCSRWPEMSPSLSFHPQ